MCRGMCRFRFRRSAAGSSPASSTSGRGGGGGSDSEGCGAGTRATELLGNLPRQRLNAAILDLVQPGLFRHVPIDQSFPLEPGIASLQLFRELLDGAGPIMVDPQLVAKVGLVVSPHAELMRVVDRPDEAGVGDGLRPAQFRGPARVGFQHAPGRLRPMAGGPEGGAADLKAGKMAVPFQDRVNVALLRREQEFVEIEERDPSRLCRRRAKAVQIRRSLPRRFRPVHQTNDPALAEGRQYPKKTIRAAILIKIKVLNAHAEMKGQPFLQVWRLV